MSDASRSENGRALALTIGAVSVVYGDSGTSPLYALRPAARDGLTGAEVIGVVSLFCSGR